MNTKTTSIWNNELKIFPASPKFGSIKEFETEIIKNINAPNIPAFKINDKGESVFAARKG